MRSRCLLFSLGNLKAILVPPSLFLSLLRRSSLSTFALRVLDGICTWHNHSRWSPSLAPLLLCYLWSALLWLFRHLRSPRRQHVYTTCAPRRSPRSPTSRCVPRTLQPARARTLPHQRTPGLKAAIPRRSTASAAASSRLLPRPSRQPPPRLYPPATV